MVEKRKVIKEIFVNLVLFLSHLRDKEEKIKLDHYLTLKFKNYETEP